MDDAQAEGGDDGALELANTTGDDDQEGVHDVSDAEVEGDRVHQRQRHTGKAGDSRTDEEGEHIDEVGGDTGGLCQVAVLHGGADLASQRGELLQQVQTDHAHHGDGEDEYPGGRHIHAENPDRPAQPGGRGRIHRLRAEDVASQLLKHQTDTEGGQQRVQRAQPHP